ncbi:MAG: Flp pilus assembly complex ATPase component TadA [Treponema sp.]|nr:Flp pilus assembly complex ATPase component TadA [Treponema sp.]
MDNHKFKLTAAYCIYNGVAVENQNGKQISFLLENLENDILKSQLTKAFENHVAFVRGLDEIPSEYFGRIKVDFKKGEKKDFRKYVSSLYAAGSGELKHSEKDECFDYENKEAAAVLLLETILNEAKSKSATDVHIEKLGIRYRVCGKLQTELKLEKDKLNELVRRIKLLSGMNVLEKRRNQEGSFVFGDDKSLHVRVSVMPVVSDSLDNESESMVLRLLDCSRRVLDLSSLGFNLEQKEKLNLLEQSENGLVLICGPTGAGKSTTAAAMLSDLVGKSDCDKKLISLEDPVEYVIPGVTQIRMTNSFGDSLKYVFRQDPDVIMIGEIRDEETCKTAVRAALTGHLVIATLHTSSLSDTFLRLKNLGSEFNILGSVIKGVIIQKMNYYENQVNLLADVCVADVMSLKQLNETCSLEEVEKMFSCYSNAAEVLKKTLCKEKSVNKNYKSAGAKRKSDNSVYPVLRKSKNIQKREAL